MSVTAETRSEVTFFPSRRNIERLEEKSFVVLDVEEASGRPRLVAALHVAPNPRNGLFVSNNPVNLVDPEGLSPVGAAQDFLDQYNKMREANWKNSDKYFHCMANCNAAKRGKSGYDTAKALSEAREANDHGREAGKNNEDCKSACEKYRPAGLPSKY